MKINSLVAKTALAAAIAGASFAASAGTLTLTTANQPSVVAVELFTGDPASDNTSITLPSITFTPDATWLAANVGTSTTIKLTLANTHAVFAADYNNPGAWAAQGVKVTVDGGTTALDASTASVEAAGNQGDNVIIIKVPAGIAAGQTVTIEGLKVWNLRNTHKDLSGTTEVNVELTATTGIVDSDDNLIAIYTAKGVTLDGKSTNYKGGAGSSRGYIEVDSTQQLFTDAVSTAAALGTDLGWNDFDTASIPHRDLFDKTQAVNQLYFGEFELKRGEVNIGTTAAPVMRPAGNEQGNNFQISGGDRVTLTLNADGADLRDYGLALHPQPAAVTTNPCSLAKISTTTYNADGTVATITGAAALGTKYNLCATVSGNDTLNTLSNLQANVAVKYTNVRYGESKGTLDYGPVYRNGCSVTLFNLPNPNAQDSAMIRFTNTSSGTQEGEVTVTVWGEDGQKLDQSVSVLPNLKTHATAILHTNANLADTENRVYLGDALEGFGASTGRSRIIVDGAFPSCEALGMVRSENGTLVNMTSTVYSDSTNNTSNTSN